MEPRMIPIDHSGNHGNHHFQSLQNHHYTSESNLSDMNNANRFPTGNFEAHSSSRRQTPNSSHEASHSQMAQSHYDYGRYIIILILHLLITSLLIVSYLGLNLILLLNES